MDVAIKAEKLTKRYSSRKSTAAIQDLDLEIPFGILFGLVGPDGAGKTTTLGILSSVMEPSSGKAWIGGFDAHSQAEKIRKCIGYMPQNFSLYPDLSVRENLNFFADIQHVPAAQKKSRITEMLAFTHLEDFEARRAGKLSGGMKKKLALACAMVHNPKVLILDEPSTGVDPVSRRELWVLLAKVVQEGVTVLVSTPYMDEAMRFNRVIFMDHGHILTQGVPRELMKRLEGRILELDTDDQIGARQIAEDDPEVEDVHTFGNHIHLRVKSAKGPMERIPVRLKSANIPMDHIIHVPATLEDVFIHLIETEGEEYEQPSPSA